MPRAALARGLVRGHDDGTSCRPSRRDSASSTAHRVRGERRQGTPADVHEPGTSVIKSSAVRILPRVATSCGTPVGAGARTSPRPASPDRRPVRGSSRTRPKRAPRCGGGTPRRASRRGLAGRGPGREAAAAHVTRARHFTRAADGDLASRIGGSPHSFHGSRGNNRSFPRRGLRRAPPLSWRDPGHGVGRPPCHGADGSLGSRRRRAQARQGLVRGILKSEVSRPAKPAAMWHQRYVSGHAEKSNSTRCIGTNRCRWDGESPSSACCPRRSANAGADFAPV